LKRFRHSSVPKNSLLFFTVPQWASFSKKLQKLITLDIVHIFLFPIQGKGKIAREIRIWTEKFEKSSFSGSNRPFYGFDHYDQPH
jgi:hypothetical protein